MTANEARQILIEYCTGEREDGPEVLEAQAVLEKENDDESITTRTHAGVR